MPPLLPLIVSIVLPVSLLACVVLHWRGIVSRRDAVLTFGATMLGLLIGAGASLSGCGIATPIAKDFDRIAKSVCAIDDSWQICKVKCSTAEPSPNVERFGELANAVCEPADSWQSCRDKAALATGEAPVTSSAKPGSFARPAGE